MTVFKNYFKIVLNNLGSIITFLSISIMIAVINTKFIDKNNKEFINEKPDIAVINYDKESKISKHFYNYLDKNFNIIKIKDDKKSLQDALYAHKVHLIIKIDKDFGKELLKGNEPKLGIKKAIEVSSNYVDILVNRYLKITNFYVNSGMSEENIIKNLDKDLKNSVKVNILETKSSGMQKLAVYFNFQNYSALGILIYTIGMIMCIFNKDVIRKRNLVSCMKTSSYTTQILLGHIVLAICYFLIVSVFGMIIYNDIFFTKTGMLILLNFFCFILSVSSMAFLIGIFVKNTNSLAGIQNVIALGLSFISGCFMPVEFIDKNVVNFSKLFPPYWYIKTNNDIARLNNFSMSSLNPIFKVELLILLFGLLYFILSIIINKLKKHA